MFFSNAVFITNSLPWNIVIVIALVAVAAVVGALVAHTHDVKNAESKVSQAEQTVRTMIEDAIKKAETIKKETIIEAREEALRLKTEQEREEKERRSELQRSERRLQQREESLDKKQDSLEQREQALAKRVKAAEAKEASIDALYEQQRAELEAWGRPIVLLFSSAKDYERFSHSRADFPNLPATVVFGIDSRHVAENELKQNGLMRGG